MYLDRTEREATLFTQNLFSDPADGNHKLTMDLKGYKPEDVNSFVMTDYGGSGHSLVTPGMLVDFFSSQQIKMVLEQNVDVIIRASLTIAKPDNSVEIGLLYSSSLDLDA